MSERDIYTLAYIVLFVVVLNFIAASRSPNDIFAVPIRRALTAKLPIATQELLKSIIDFAFAAGYKIELFDEEKHYIVLSSNGSFWEWGYFYPIRLTDDGCGYTLLEVGIMDIISSTSGARSRRQKQCFNGIVAYVFRSSNSTSQ